MAGSAVSTQLAESVVHAQNQQVQWCTLSVRLALQGLLVGSAELAEPAGPAECIKSMRSIEFPQSMASVECTESLVMVEVTESVGSAV